MQIVPNQVNDYLLEGGYISANLSIEGTAGTINLTSENIIENSLSIDRNSVSGSNLEIGNAETSELTFELDNEDQEFDSFKFEGAQVALTLVIDGDALPAGVYIIDSPPKRETTLKIKALDNMSRFNRYYDTNLVYPATLMQIVQDACLKCGVTLYNTSFTNSSYTVAERPSGDDLTYHEIVACAAELAGCNAWCDWLGQLRFSWYGETQTDPFTVGPSMRYNYNLAENDITITGLTFRTDEADYQYGTTDYSLLIENNVLMPGTPDTNVLGEIFAKLDGFSYRPYEFSIDGLPHVWPGDVIDTIDTYTGGSAKSIITNHRYQLNGLSRISAKGQTAELAGQKGPTPFTASQKTILQTVAKKESERQVTALEQSVLNLNQLMSNSLGLYETIVTDPGTGAKTFYTHDSPTLEGSQVIYVKNELGFAWTDQGWNGGVPAWQYGVSADGNAVLKVLSLFGINANWINSGEVNSSLIRIGESTLPEVIGALTDEINRVQGGGTNFVRNGSFGDYDTPSDYWWNKGLTWLILEARQLTWAQIHTKNLTWAQFQAYTW